MRRQAVLSNFDPASLFGGTEGAWYDPYDLSTLWQDSAKTTRVTADGDPIGYIADKSGFGHDLSQATSANRPNWKTSNGQCWIEYGTAQDRWLSGTLPTATFGGNLARSFVAGVQPSGNTGGPTLLFIGAESALACWGMEEAGGPGIGLFTFDATGDVYASGQASTTNHILTGIRDGNSTSTIRKNASVIVGPTSAAAINITSNSFVLGRGMAGGGWKGRIYGFMLVPYELKASQLQGAERWMAARSGVGL